MSGSFLFTDYIQYMMPEIVLFMLGSLILLVGPFLNKNTPWALISSLGFYLLIFCSSLKNMIQLIIPFIFN